jgi:hypothetical protein
MHHGVTEITEKINCVSTREILRVLCGSVVNVLMSLRV